MDLDLPIPVQVGSHLPDCIQLVHLIVLVLLTLLESTMWHGGVVVRLLDLRVAVMGSNPGHGIAGFSEVGDRFFRVNYLR